MQTIPTLVATASSCLLVLPNVLVGKYCHGPMLSQLRIISSVGDGVMVCGPAAAWAGVNRRPAAQPPKLA